MTDIVPYEPLNNWGENPTLAPYGNPRSREANRIMAALRCNRPSCECHRPEDLVHCPVHPGILPKLLLDQTNDGKLYFDCFMKCSHDDIVDALNRLGIVPLRGAPAAQPPPELHVRRIAADIPRPMVWLWPNYIPLGALTLIHGAPGAGKSWIALDLAARVSSASPPPNSDIPMTRGPVCLVAPFADSNAILSPRLTDLNADFDDVMRLKSIDRPNGSSTPLKLPKDASHLIDLVVDMEVRLLIIDPIEEVSAERGLRSSLNALAWVAARTGTAVVATCHVKGLALDQAMTRAAGKQSPAASVLVTGLLDPQSAPWSPDGAALPRALASVKNSHGPIPPAVPFGIQSAAPTVWGNPTPTDQLLHPAPISVGPKTADALTVIRDLLAQGPRPAAEVTAHALERGITQAAIDRAKRHANVRSTRRNTPGLEGHGTWIWTLPDTQQLELALKKEGRS